jgi:hypothetical protein
MWVDARSSVFGFDNFASISVRKCHEVFGTYYVKVRGPALLFSSLLVTAMARAFALNSQEKSS